MQTSNNSFSIWLKNSSKVELPLGGFHDDLGVIFSRFPPSYFLIENQYSLLSFPCFRLRTKSKFDQHFKVQFACLGSKVSYIHLLQISLVILLSSVAEDWKTLREILRNNWSKFLLQEFAAIKMCPFSFAFQCGVKH